ncbi:hypothetical protein ACLOJK_030980 [Asimina triloba]
MDEKGSRTWVMFGWAFDQPRGAQNWRLVQSCVESRKKRVKENRMCMGREWNGMGWDATATATAADSSAAFPHSPLNQTHCTWLSLKSIRPHPQSYPRRCQNRLLHSANSTLFAQLKCRQSTHVQVDASYKFDSQLNPMDWPVRSGSGNIARNTMCHVSRVTAGFHQIALDASRGPLKLDPSPRFFIAVETTSKEYYFAAQNSADKVAMASSSWPLPRLSFIAVALAGQKKR